MNELSQLLTVASNLAEKIREVESNPDFGRLFYRPGFEYKGPDWNLELVELEDVIKDIRYFLSKQIKNN